MQQNELKAARKSLAMSQAEFAERIGVSRVLVGQMERGDAPITDRTSTAVEMLLAKIKIISDVFSVRENPQGGYVVVRGTQFEHDHPTAMYWGQSRLLLYGVFSRRDHAYRWATALKTSDSPRNTRRLLREREADARAREQSQDAAKSE
jgi:Predicted transcriptional regulators